MKYKRMITKPCGWCGKLFETGRDNCFYCSEDCKREKRRQTSREYNHNHRKESEEIRIQEKSLLAEKNAKARAAGMSYGQYDVALRLGRVANG